MVWADVEVLPKTLSLTGTWEQKQMRRECRQTSHFLPKDRHLLSLNIQFHSEICHIMNVKQVVNAVSCWAHACSVRPTSLNIKSWHELNQCFVCFIPTDKLPVTSPLALRALSVTFSEECSRRAESCYEEKNEQNSWLNQSINLYIHLFLSICHLSLSVCLSVSVCLLLPLWSGFPGHREGTGSLIHPPVSAHLHWLAGIPCLPDNTESFLNISVTSCNITQC